MEKLSISPDSLETGGAEQEGEILAGGAGEDGGAVVPQEGVGEGRGENLGDPAKFFKSSQ